MPEKNENSDAGKSQQKLDDAASKQDKQDTTPKQDEAPAPAKTSDPKYPVARIIENAHVLTGYESWEVAGALADEKDDLTGTEAAKRVEKFLKAEIPNPDESEED